MGLLEAVTGPFVYLDTNIFIYAHEAHAIYTPALVDLFNAIDHYKLQAVTSELTLAEALVYPMKNSNTLLQNAYQLSIISKPGLIVVPMSRALLIEAASIRAATGLQLADSIHAATSLRGQCETFITNDIGFRKVPTLPVLILSENV